MAVKKTLLSRIVSRLSRPAKGGPAIPGQASMLTVAAASYGFSPEGSDKTMPTGFDPHAAALFEAMVEAGYLVCSADGVFDDAERKAFRSVVVEACQGAVMDEAIEALLQDLEEQRREDGVQVRIEMVAKTVTNDQHRLEVLRIASLLAHVSEGVGPEEQDVLRKLADAMGISESRLNEIIDEADRALADSA